MGRPRTVYIAGHAGLLGSAYLRRLSGQRDARIVTATHAQLELTDARAVDEWLALARPETLVLAAGRVGGIEANAARPAQFIYDNLLIEANLIHGAWKAGVGRVINFGSACMYPKRCRQPMRPEQLLTGALEPTSQPYAIAKLAGWTLCDAYRRQYGAQFFTVIPCTLYGPGDDFDLQHSHVVSALIRKLHDAAARGERSVTLWGGGSARREFLYVDDLVDACEILLSLDGVPDEPVNVGSGESVAIRDLAALIADLVGFRGELRWDAARAEGPSEKWLDSSVMRSAGWTPATTLRTGLERTIHWWRQHDGAGLKETACASS